MRRSSEGAGLLDGYALLPGTFDELLSISRAPGAPHDLKRVEAAIASLSAEEFARAQALAELSMLNQGVTFSVYADQRGTEKIFPFCLIPRVISAVDWNHIERGLTQRVLALEAFLNDVYGEQKVVEKGVLPAEMLASSRQYLPQLRGVKATGGTRIVIAGIDLIRDPGGVVRVLEDNLRTPSGVSYVLENRVVTKRVLPQVFEEARVRRVDHYPTRLAETLVSVAPDALGAAAAHTAEEGSMVLLTPGPYNSAYFEHTFLARMMGVPLVQAADLVVESDMVFLRTVRGLKRVRVIYRRIDDAFLDPEAFRADSLLGVRGVMRAWKAGNVTLANAPGNGVADDKAIYPFVHDFIRFYLGEEPILEQVPTWVCARDDERRFVLEHLSEMVVKAVDEAGGYGMLMGPQATRGELEAFAAKIRAEPRKFIAQRRVELSSCPTWIAGKRTVEPRRVDLRPYVLSGPEGPWVLPGGLTRVALVEGSYVVNSSQGGGSKDTWVMKD